MMRVLVHTGARPKELCDLRWHHVRWSGWTTAAGDVAAKAVLPPREHKTGKATGVYIESI